MFEYVENIKKYVENKEKNSELPPRLYDFEDLALYRGYEFGKL